MARRVLQVCQPEDGGVAEHVLVLSSGLVERGWEVEAAVSPDSTIASGLARAGVVIHELPLTREPGWGDLRAATALRALDHDRGYAIVHGHSSKAGALVRGILPCRRRLVYTPHCFAFAAMLGSARRVAYKAVEQALMPRCGAIVAVCAWERGLALRHLHGAGSRTRVVYNGVPDCTPAEPSRELLAFRGEEPLAGLVTVLRPQKDPLLAVRAAASLAHEGRLPGRLAIVGNGELRDRVRDEIARLGVGERVRWFPFQARADAYLRALDLLVLPSAWESLPLAVLEAMSCGVPVLATSVGGVPEAVEDSVTGRVVAPGDEPALAAALSEILGSPDLRRQYSEAGRAEFERRFRVAPMVDAVAALYAELMVAS
jgi:glycosyltransferase involved in cell wall biosynthesis